MTGRGERALYPKGRSVEIVRQRETLLSLKVPTSDTNMSVVASLVTLLDEQARRESPEALNAQRPVGYETLLAAGSSARARGTNSMERSSTFGKVY